MNIKILIKALTELAAKYPDATVYFGRKDGSAPEELIYLLGEYVDSKLCNHRAFCLGERLEVTRDLDDEAIYDFDTDTAYTA